MMRSMARKSVGPGPGPRGPAPGIYPIESGTAEIVRDRNRPAGHMLLVNGVESSHADLADPGWLEFEYLRWMAAVIEQHLADRPRYLALHLGAAGCSLARALLAARPDTRHLAVEIDARLAVLVRNWFELPRAPFLRIRVGEARQVTATLPDSSRDVVVRDVFAGAMTPYPLTTIEFARDVHRVLRPGGLYLLNCADSPDLTLARHEAATVAAVFEHLVTVADPPMLKGRRRGNIVLAGSDVPIGDAALVRELRGGAVPAQLWNSSRTRAFASATTILHDRPPGQGVDFGAGLS